jgi:hypothetical protein
MSIITKSGDNTIINVFDSNLTIKNSPNSGNVTKKTIRIDGGNATSGSNIEGNNIVIKSGDGDGYADGGNIEIYSGNSSTGDSGDINIYAAYGGSNGGDIRLYSGGTSSGTSGNIYLQSGVSPSNSGTINITTLSPTTSGNSGSLNISTGNAAGSGNGGNINISAGNSGSSGVGGNVNITAGSGVSFDGDINLEVEGDGLISLIYDGSRSAVFGSNTNFDSAFVGQALVKGASGVLEYISVVSNIDGYVLQTRQINTGTGLVGGGNLTTNRTISLQSGLLDGYIEGITVRRNSGGNVGPQPRLNFIEGANISLSISNDSLNNEIDITITGNGGGGGGGTGTLFQTLAMGNSTDGYDVEFTLGSNIVTDTELNIITGSGNAAIFGSNTNFDSASIGQVLAKGASGQLEYINQISTDGYALTSTVTSLTNNLQSQINFVEDTLDGYARNAITISTGTGLSGGGNLTSNRTISLQSGLLDGYARFNNLDGYATINYVNTQDNITRAVLDGYVLQTRQINTGPGLTGGGNLTTNRTISLQSGLLDGYALSSTVTSLTNNLQSQINFVEDTLDGYARNTVTISAGSGLSGGGNLTANRTISLQQGLLDGYARNSSLDGYIRGVIVRENSGSNIGTQPRLNFIEGSNISMTIANDPGNNEIDIIINAIGVGGSTDGYVFQTRQVNTGPGLSGGGDLSQNRTISLQSGLLDGYVIGPASSTDNAIARFDLTTGKLIQGSGIIIDDSNNLSGIGNITLSGTVDGIDVSTIPSTYALQTTLISAGSGLSGGGNLSTSRTISLQQGLLDGYVRNIDGYVLQTRQVNTGIGLSGGGDLTSNRTISIATGYLDGYARNSSLDGYVPTSRTITAGNGLTGGGSLNSNILLDVVANADGSIIVNANDIQVGILATDTQHGNRGGGSLHSIATTGSAGFMSAADKQKLNAISLDGYALNSVSINAGPGLSGGGNLTTSRTISIQSGLLDGYVLTGDSRLSNDRTASGIRTASTIVSVSSATAPTNTQVLKATSSINASWSNVTSSEIVNLNSDVSSTAYAFILPDAGRNVRTTNNLSSVTLSVPTNALAPFPVGSEIYITQYGTSSVTVDGYAGVNIRLSDNKSNRLIGRYSLAQLTKVGTDEWILTGELQDINPINFDGYVEGPISSTDNAIARYDGYTGELIQNSGVIIDDSNNISGIGNITLSGTVDGVDVSTIPSTYALQSTTISAGAGLSGGGNLSTSRTISLQSGLLDGYVRGPVSSTDNAIARFDLTTGRLIQDSGVVISDSGNDIAFINSPGLVAKVVRTQTQTSLNDQSNYLDLVTGAGNGTGASGQIRLLTGDSTNQASSGAIIVRTGAKSTIDGYSTGNVTVASGSNTAIGTSGILTFRTGDTTNGATGQISSITGAATLGASGQNILSTGNTTNATSGGTVISTGANTSTGNTGGVTVSTGTTASGTTGNISIQPGTATVGTGGNLNLIGGTSSSGGTGGTVTIRPGTGSTVGVVAIQNAASQNAIRINNTCNFDSAAINSVLTKVDANSVGYQTLASLISLTLDGYEKADQVVNISSNPSPSVATLQASNIIYACSVNSGAFTITLPSGCSVGTKLTVKDRWTGGIQAGTNNITVQTSGSDTIDGSATFVISSNLASITLIKGTSTDWLVL